MDSVLDLFGQDAVAAVEHEDKAVEGDGAKVPGGNERWIG
jgi:hypothetical protein